MAKENKYEAAMEAVVQILKDDPYRRHDVASVIQQASEKSEWKYLEGIRLGVKALIAAKVVKTNYNGKEIQIMPETDPAKVGFAEQEKLLRESIQKAQDAEKQWKAGLQNALDRAKTAEESVKNAAKPSPVLEVRITDEKGKVVRSVKGSFHAAFPRILALAKARKNIFIYGPTGCGKTHIARQLAEVLGLEFAFISCSAGMAEGKLEGRLLPTGEGGAFEYSISEFIKCYEQGGVYLIDEIDAADPNVLLLINAALANGHVAVPNRPEKPYAARHKDFICIAAANTVGTGADRMYSGRNKLDAATLDRFQIGKIMMDYDASVEEKLCPDELLRKRLTKYRNNIRSHRLERALSTRFMQDAYDMLQLGWTAKEIDDALFTGWRDDEISKVKGY